MRLLEIAIIIASCFLIDNYFHYENFSDAMIKQYRKDERLRPDGTFVYVPSVMNLLESPEFRRLSIEDRRSRLFDLLSQGKMCLVYPFALDTTTQAVYSNPRGDLDYWEHRKRKIEMIKSNFDNWHPLYVREMKALLKYAKENRPDVLFTICEIDEMESRLYWAIKNNSIFAVLYNPDSNVINEYGAMKYVAEIAPDYVFSSILRLEMYSSE